MQDQLIKIAPPVTGDADTYGWIDASQLLPEYGQRVWVRVTRADYPPVRMSAFRVLGTSGGWYWSSRENLIQKAEVTHWHVEIVPELPEVI